MEAAEGNANDDQAQRISTPSSSQRTGENQRREVKRAEQVEALVVLPEMGCPGVTKLFTIQFLACPEIVTEILHTQLHDVHHEDIHATSSWNGIFSLS